VKALDLIGELTAESQNLPEVLAPVLSPEGVVAVINQHPYKFHLELDTSGWFVIRPVSSEKAEVSREAYPYEILKYLGGLPRLYCIVCRRLGNMSWLVYPFNMGDARQRFGHMEFPRAMHLVTQNIEPLQPVETRVMGSTLLFGQIGNLYRSDDNLSGSLGGGMKPDDIKFPFPEIKTVYCILYEEMEERRKREFAEKQKAKLKTLEGRIEDAVSYLGAKLVSFQERGEDLVVRWRDGRRTQQVTVTRDLRLVTAGVCLSGRERQQSLTSAVAVMRDHERMDRDW